MSFKSILLALALPALIATGCVADDLDPNSERVPLGKADAYGSCAADDCGDKSSDGNCWCDDLCTSYGDCCDNKVAACDCPEVMCEIYCINGFATDENGCEICECKPAFCGGFAGIACPDGQICIDDPSDDCDNNNGGADCGGICVLPEQCGGFAYQPCPAGKNCIDNPWDDCDPENGGADCGGICVPAPCPDGTAYCALFCAGAYPSQPPPHCEIPGCVCDEEPAADSCEDNCGGKSDDGSCWCDSWCESYGDCCSDKADLC